LLFYKGEAGELFTGFIGSKDQLADILSKSLRGLRIQFIHSKLVHTSSLKGRVKIISTIVLYSFHKATFECMYLA